MDTKEDYEPRLMEIIGNTNLHQEQKESLLTEITHLLEEQVKAERERIRQALVSVFGDVIDEPILEFLDKYVRGGK